MESPGRPIARARWRYAAATLATIGAGLASRAYSAHLPWWLAKNAGDALYATMVFWGFGFLAPRARTARVALTAIAFCFAIELTQLYRAPWIDVVRATTPGRLVLGQGFHAFDLVCYVIGVDLGIGLELTLRRLPVRGLSSIMGRNQARRQPGQRQSGSIRNADESGHR